MTTIDPFNLARSAELPTMNDNSPFEPLPTTLPELLQAWCDWQSRLPTGDDDVDDDVPEWWTRGEDEIIAAAQHTPARSEADRAAKATLLKRLLKNAGTAAGRESFVRALCDDLGAEKAAEEMPATTAGWAATEFEAMTIDFTREDWRHLYDTGFAWLVIAREMLGKDKTGLIDVLRRFGKDFRPQFTDRYVQASENLIATFTDYIEMLNSTQMRLAVADAALELEDAPAK